MHHHRLLSHFERHDSYQPATASVPEGSFMSYPVGLWQGLTLEQRLTQQHIYQLALAQAQAAQVPSAVEWLWRNTTN